MSTTIPISDFRELHKQGFDFTFPDTSFEIIKILFNDLGEKEVVLPSFQNNSNTSTGSSKPSDSAWKYSCSSSNLLQKSNINKDITDLKLCLNKISKTTFDNMTDKIQVILDKVLVDNNDNNNNDKMVSDVSECIFDTVMRNKFYSELYAKLYATILTRYPDLKPSFQHHLDTYTNRFDEIRYADPDKDYDLYCEITKENTKRKAISQFFANLVTFDIISVEIITKMTVHLIELLNKYADEPNKGEVVDEVVENLAILFPRADTDGEVKTTVKKFAECKPMQMQSLASKSIFKLRDLNK